MKASILDIATDESRIVSGIPARSFYSGDWSCDCLRDPYRQTTEHDSLECRGHQRYLVVAAELDREDSEDVGNLDLVDLNQRYPPETLARFIPAHELEGLGRHMLGCPFCGTRPAVFLANVPGWVDIACPANFETCVARPKIRDEAPSGVRAWQNRVDPCRDYLAVNIYLSEAGIRDGEQALQGFAALPESTRNRYREAAMVYALTVAPDIP